MPNLIFMDSWDHYNAITDKWTFTGTDCSIDLTSTKSRTGIGCLLILSAAFGPQRNFANSAHITVGTAYYVTGSGFIVGLKDQIANEVQVSVRVESDGSLQVFNDTAYTGSSPLGITAPGVYQFNTYNYVELSVFCHATLGTVKLRVNGIQVLSLTNKNTAPSGSAVISALQLMGPGGIPTSCRHDDVYIADWTATPAAPFYGPIKLYCVLPTADETPLQWTPSAALPHFSLVDEVPPNGDTDYVFDGTAGEQDQYQYTSTTMPAGASIVAVQHTLDGKLDAAGARSIASSVNGAVDATSFPLTSGYLMYTTPYDTNPGTAVPWVLGDFPANFGPDVAA